MPPDIRTLRDTLGITTAQLAILVGVQARTAHRWRMVARTRQSPW